MKCASIGYPLTSITWRAHKSNTVLISSEENSTSSALVSSISFQNLTKSHTGNYSCELNQNPTQKKIFYLIVQSKEKLFLSSERCLYNYCRPMRLYRVALNLGTCTFKREFTVYSRESVIIRFFSAKYRSVPQQTIYRSKKIPHH